MESKIKGSYQVRILTSDTTRLPEVVQEWSFQGERYEAWAFFRTIVERQSGPDPLHPKDGVVELFGRHLEASWRAGKIFWVNVLHQWCPGSKLSTVPPLWAIRSEWFDKNYPIEDEDETFWEEEEKKERLLRNLMSAQESENEEQS